MSKLTIMLASALFLGALGCGSSSDSGTVTGTTGGTTGGATNGTFTAQVNGSNWSAIGVAAVTRNTSTLLVFAGTGPIGSSTYSISLGLPGATTAGTYSLAFANSVGAQLLVIATPSGSWSTSLSGGTGSVTFTTVTSNHIVGTFTADAPATAGSGGATLQIRNGKFDLTF